jgi:alpha-amylase
LATKPNSKRFLAGLLQVELARPGTRNGVDALIEVHHKFAGGAMEIMHADPDLYVMQRTGFEEQPGLIFVLNNLGNQWSGTSVKTQWENQKFVPAARDGHDVALPTERTTDDEGNAEFPAPPRGFAVYVPAWDAAFDLPVQFLSFVHKPSTASWQSCKLDYPQ